MSKKLEKIKDILENVNVKDLKVYNFNHSSPFYDYFVIATATDRQSNACSNYLKAEFEEEILGIEGKQSGWVLVDIGDIIVHLFTAENREFYGFDKMLYGFLEDEE